MGGSCDLVVSEDSITLYSVNSGEFRNFEICANTNYIKSKHTLFTPLNDAGFIITQKF